MGRPLTSNSRNELLDSFSGFVVCRRSKPPWLGVRFDLEGTVPVSSNCYSGIFTFLPFHIRGFFMFYSHAAIGQTYGTVLYFLSRDLMRDGAVSNKVFVTPFLKPFRCCRLPFSCEIDPSRKALCSSGLRRSLITRRGNTLFIRASAKPDLSSRHEMSVQYLITSVLKMLIWTSSMDTHIEYSFRP